MPKVPQAPPVLPDRLVAHGDRLGWQHDAVIMGAPGHTPGHVAAWLTRIGCSSPVTRSASHDGQPMLGVFNADPATTAATAQLATLDADIACFGHGEPLRSDAAARLAQLIVGDTRCRALERTPVRRAGRCPHDDSVLRLTIRRIGLLDRTPCSTRTRRSMTGSRPILGQLCRASHVTTRPAPRRAAGPGGRRRSRQVSRVLILAKPPAPARLLGAHSTSPDLSLTGRAPGSGARVVRLSRDSSACRRPEDPDSGGSP